MSFFPAGYQAFTMLMFLENFQGRIKYVMFHTLSLLKERILPRVPANISQNTCSTKYGQRNATSPGGLCSQAHVQCIIHNSLHSPGETACWEANHIVSQKEDGLCCCFPGEMSKA